MKLVTSNGELDLPVDFSFELEYNNPFFSDEGDASVPATIPATPNNLRVLDNIHRVDRANRFMKSVPATLMAGTIQKHGQLIIDTLSMKDGISVSLAVENSDLYSQYKNKSLKEIFASKVRDDWNQDIAALANYLLGIRFNHSTDDFTIFPVAVAPYEENDAKIYQYNNEGTNYLIWQARTVREGDLTMSVTDGYGLSPFLYLYRMINLLFEQMGYTVIYNCLDREPYRDIVLLNNCSDTIVKGIINYSDLVPSCSLSEFIDFLHNKFGILCRVDSTSKRVLVIMLQDILSSSTPDMDITTKVADDFDIIINDTSRVVLSSETSIDNTAPAAETFDKLIEKYGYYIEITENQYNNILNDIPIGINDCIVMRQETGQFYELRRNIGSDKITPVYIGTNNFKYDRNNSSTQESFSSSDVMPAIIYDRLPYMYIGDRLHSNTTYNSSEESTEQPIMIAWKTVAVAGSFAMAFGTTQKYFYSRKFKDFSLTTYEMYDHFWSNYNNILRNGKIALKGTVLYDITDIASLDMTKIKVYKGQKLLPLKTTYEISDKLKNKDSEFLLVKDFSNSEKDKAITPGTKQRYKWKEDYQFNETDIENLKSKFPYVYQGLYAGYLYDMIAYYDGYTYKIKSAIDENINIGIPKYEGEISTSISVNCELNPKARIYFYTNGVVGEEINVSPPNIKIFSHCDIRYKSVPV